MKIAEIMTAPALTASPEMALREAASILVEKRISGLPVVDSDGCVVGVISDAQILLEEQPPQPEQRGLFGRLFAHGDTALRKKLDVPTVGEAMSTPPITISPDAPVSSAADVMLESRVRRLPVVDASGKLLGIVTRADLVRAFVRSDDAIAHDIHHVIELFSVPSAGVHVAVDAGNVALTGMVDTKMVAEAIPPLVERIPGVVSVAGDLQWRFDPELSHDRDVIGGSHATEEGTP